MPSNLQIKTNLSTTWNSSTGTSYSTIPLLSGIKHKDQLEIERPFTTPTGVTLAQEDLRSIFVIPSSNFEVDEVNKKITVLTAPATYLTSNNITVTIPVISNGDAIKIRRKSISSETLVSWVDGTRLTASQLNLQSSQLLNLAQEILDRLKYEYVTSTDIDYNATYNSATRSWVESRLGAIGAGTAKAYIDAGDASIGSSITALNNKVGINTAIIGASNTDVVTKLNYLEGLVGGQLFTGFPQASIVIVGASGVKDYSSNFTLIKGSPDVLALTGNQNLTGKLTLQGVSTNDILSIKNSSGNEVNKIDQYGNISNAAAPTTQPPNPIVGSLYFNTTNSNLSVYTGSGWQSAGTFNAPSNQVTLDTIQNITHAKSFSANTGFGISSNPLTIVDITGPASVTSFTGTTRLGTTVRGSTAATDYSGIDLTGGTSGTNPKARIAALFEAGGSKLQLGTSNNYTNGITNTGLTIDSSGNIGILQTSPSFNLDVTGTARFTGLVNLNDNTTLNNNKNLRFFDSGNTARNAFKLNNTDKYQLGDIDNAITDSDVEIYAKRNIEFFTNNVEIARITDTGRLGIGTQTPSTKLHIVTNATANTITQGDGSGTLTIGLDGSSSGSISHTGASSANKLTISSDREIVLSGSNTTVASGRELNTNTIKSISTSLQLQDSTAANKVGIGISTPSEKLEVDGNIKATTGNKIISDTVETGIIQSTGTIEFRQGYTANATADMTIDANGIVVFNQTPKVGANSIIVPESPVVCGAHNSASTFRFNASHLTHYHSASDGTGYAVSYLKQGKVVYVYGIIGCSDLGSSGSYYAIDGGGGNHSNDAVLRGLPAPAMKKWHFHGLAYCGTSEETATTNLPTASTLVRRNIYGGYVSSDGYLRINGGLIEGSKNTLSNLLPASYGTSTVANAIAYHTQINPNGWMVGPGTVYSSSDQTAEHGDRIYWYSTGSYFQGEASSNYSRLFFVNKGTTSSQPPAQYVILNFSYIAL